MKPVPDSEAAPIIACVLAAGEASERLWHRRDEEAERLRGIAICRTSATQFRGPRQPEDATSSPSDFGLSGREAGMWGRLRATGLSDQDAADVVRACRMEHRQ